MPLTNAEKQRLHRQKIKAEREELARRREAERDLEQTLEELNSVRATNGLSPIAQDVFRRFIDRVVASNVKKLETWEPSASEKAGSTPTRAGLPPEWGIF